MNKEFDFAPFRKRLLELRTAGKKSQMVLSELCGIHRSAIARYERGSAIPSVNNLVAIADYFGVSIDYLLCRSNTLKN